jgi:FkbM family methyltransferase
LIKPEWLAVLTEDALTAEVEWARPALKDSLCLYGNGKLGKLAQDFFARVGVQHLGVFENDEVTPYGDVQVAICIVTSPFVQVYHRLRQLGFHNIVPFYDLADNYADRHPLQNGWFAGPLSMQEQYAASKVLHQWHDDASRAHHLQFIAYRRLREEWHFEWAEPTFGDQHFIPEVREVLHDHEVFIDGGAYRGEISSRFAEVVGHKYKWIFAVEPDTDSYNHLLTRPEYIPRMMVLGWAITAESGITKFWGGFDYASKVSPLGNTSVMGRSIDTFDVVPTFIKLHLEGGELDALRGARETLVRHRPIVTASVDHNADGIYRTAEYLMELLENYCFLFRCHAWCGANAIIYAIPNERKKVRR